MRNRLASLVLGFSALTAHAKNLVRVHLDDTRPTQSTVGLEEVRLNLPPIRDAVAEGPAALDEFLRKRPGSVIRGPSGQLYLADGHHFARALHEAGLTEMYIEIKKDWSDKTSTEFWDKMREKQKVYLKKFGREITPEQLPPHIVELEDDAYRSLAWILKRRGVYDDVDTPYQEFLYADYLRDKMTIDFSTNDAMERTVQTATEWVHKGKNELPGAK